MIEILIIKADVFASILSEQLQPSYSSKCLKLFYQLSENENSLFYRLISLNYLNPGSVYKTI